MSKEEQKEKESNSQEKVIFAPEASRTASSDKPLLIPKKFGVVDKLTDITKDIEKQKNEIDKINKNLWLVLIIVISMFIVAFFAMLQEAQKDEWLYTEYNDLYKSYSKENTILKDEVHRQQIEINDLRNEIELLRAKNPYLK